MVRIGAIIAIGFLVGVIVAIGILLMKSGSPCASGVGGAAGTIGFWVQVGAEYQWQCHDLACLEDKYYKRRFLSPLGLLLEKGTYDTSMEEMKTWAEGEEGSVLAGECVRSKAKKILPGHFFGCYKASCMGSESGNCHYDTHGVYFQNGSQPQWACLDGACMRKAIEGQVQTNVDEAEGKETVDLAAAGFECSGISKYTKEPAAGLLIAGSFS